MAMLNTGIVPGWVVISVYLIGCWQLGAWTMRALIKLWAWVRKKEGHDA